MNIKDILEELGYKLTDFGSHWRTSAVYRGGNTPTSVQIYKNSGVWCDYGSGGEEFLPFILLVQKTLGTNNPDVLRKYVKGKVGKPPDIKRSLLKEEKIYPDNCLMKLLPHYDFYLDKKISEDTLRLYEGGLATSGKFYQRFVFPIRNKNKRIHGFSGRAMTDNNVKWLHMGKKSNWIYPYFNIDDVRNSIEISQCVFLVESIGDSLSLFERGLKNHLVVFGLNVSPKLASFLSASGWEIVFALNNNKRAKQAAVKNIVNLSSTIDVDRLWLAPPPKEDFGDMQTQEEINEYKESVGRLNHQQNTKEIVDILDETLENINNKSFSRKAKSFKKKINGL